MTLGDWRRLPWTFEGPGLLPDADGCYVIRIQELPGFVAAGQSREEVFADLPEALEEFLASYLEYGEIPPQPANPETWQIAVAGVTPAGGGTALVVRAEVATGSTISEDRLQAA
ncbi:MAG: type II toxin-antitoxin system HicB family antitoxin [Gemmatimonadales bacterium]